MINRGRDILVIFSDDQIDEAEVAKLDRILQLAETPDAFCGAHELVDRNRITSCKKTILREARHYRLRPFRFLINKN
jgi:hypothetical protein